MVKDGYRHVSLNMPEEIADRIDELAQLNRRDRSAEITIACERYIEADYRMTISRLIKMIPDEEKRQTIKELLEEEHTSRCPRCRRPTEANSHFCKICGQALTEEAANLMKVMLADVDNALQTEPKLAEEMAEEMIVEEMAGQLIREKEQKRT